MAKSVECAFDSTIKLNSCFPITSHLITDKSLDRRTMTIRSNVYRPFYKRPLSRIIVLIHQNLVVVVNSLRRCNSFRYDPLLGRITVDADEF